MPRTQYRIITPQGEFTSARHAAAALNCDPGTIVKRCETDPENYQRVAYVPAPGPARPTPVRRSRFTWPLTWNEYRFLSEDVKQEIYHTWCEERHADPDLESTADAFFDAMDHTEPQESDPDVD